MLDDKAFDLARMEVAEEWRCFKVDMLVDFLDADEMMRHGPLYPFTRGTIVGIFTNVTYRSGMPVVLFAIRAGDKTFLKTHQEIAHVIE